MKANYFFHKINTFIDVIKIFSYTSERIFVHFPVLNVIALINVMLKASSCRRFILVLFAEGYENYDR